MTYVKWPGFDSSLVPCVDQDPEAGDGPGHDALLRGHRLLPLQPARPHCQHTGGESYAALRIQTGIINQCKY